MSLKITEIFYSLQGETNRSGLPTVFVRLTGCPMRCGYCDTAYAFHGGTRWSIEDILAEVAKYKTPYVTVTGGEPLAQPGCWNLLTTLCNKGYDVSLETGNAVSIADIDERVAIILDIKTPASGEEPRNVYANLDLISGKDSLKFVICNQQDYEWSKQLVLERGLSDKCEILFSPVADSIDPTDIAEWVLADQLPVRFQMQLHKLLWQDSQGR
ncbi:MAG: 7-carboxy-7-deazaguanine synthase QueE [Pseudomonadota bacterium]